VDRVFKKNQGKYISIFIRKKRQKFFKQQNYEFLLFFLDKKNPSFDGLALYRTNPLKQ